MPMMLIIIPPVARTLINNGGDGRDRFLILNYKYFMH